MSEAEILFVLQATNDKLDRLLCLLERGQTTAHTPEITKHLQPIAQYFNGEPFTAGELIDEAKEKRHRILKDAITALVQGEPTAKKLGCLFRNIEGVESGGLRLERAGGEHGSVLWRIAVCGFGNPPNPCPIEGVEAL